MKKDRIHVWKVPGSRYRWMMLCPCCGFLTGELFFQLTLNKAWAHIAMEHRTAF